MKSLCTCAALAVAAAFAQQQFADGMLRSNAISVRTTAINPSEFEDVEGGDYCVGKINEFRKELVKTPKDYIKSTQTPSTELTAVADGLTCEKLFQGQFEHIKSDLFMITAAKSTEEVSENMTCDEALAEWRKSFADFQNQHPPPFKDYTLDDSENVYNKPNAVGLFGLLQKEAQTVACGSFSGCPTQNFLFCYFKPATIQAKTNVDPDLWHALEVQHSVKPGLEAQGKGDASYLQAVNDVRGASGLSLAAFTNPLQGLSRAKRSDVKPSLKEAVQTYLYQLTCEDINSSKIKPAAEGQDFTVIYYIKKGGVAPKLAEAVEHWQTGFAKLNYKIPPVFKLESLNDTPVVKADAADPAVEASKIYNDSAVAGFVSIMTEETRQMACVEVTGCEGANSGIICFLQKPTLVKDEQPISRAVWTKIMKQHGYTLPELNPLEEGKNCLAEMNAVRTQEKLGLKPFLATTANARTSGASSAVMQSVTCEAMDTTTAKSTASTGAQIMIADGTTSLVYHTGTDGTCSEAVEAFKKGYEKFSTAPPAYDPALALYQDPAATNFASLISDGENTKVTCYSTNCAKKSLVCELSPAALKEGEKPVSEATFKKYTEIVKPPETSGAAGSSRAALVGTVVTATAAGVFFF